MPNPLIPELTGGRLSVADVMARPTIIRDRIAKLAENQILLPHLFRPYGARVEGGAMLYTMVKNSDFFTADPLEPRSPGAEYAILRGQDPESRLALVNDFGGRVQVLDEVILRGDIDAIEAATLQLTNRIVRALDVRAVAAIEAAAPQSIAVALPWDEVLTVGPADLITSSARRPSASWAAGAELMELAELGNVADTLLVHPTQRTALVTAYAENLPDVLEAAGLKLVSNPRITEGTAYLVQAKAAGTVGFEVPLTVEPVPDRGTRSTYLQAFCVPAFAVTNPGAVVKLTALS